MSEKIRPQHLERGACVYVRQSTMYQVRHNLESGRRQYALVEQARKLGFRKVTVIDDDLGRSGTGSKERPGFAKLVASVCEAGLGAVFALEASRLARNNRDWHHLIDLCALAGTLVVDHDGIYDPRILNDRLLLGLKGTMSEFELGIMRQRAHEALREKIRRGEVLTRVPVGYVRTEDNRAEMTPDRQVREAIRGVFAKFRELGSGRQVLLWYCQERVPLPSLRPGPSGDEVIWRLPVYSRVMAILKNPIYAGAFAHGRRSTKTVIVDGRARKTYGHDLPMERWKVLIRDHHPGYISWDEYVRNRKTLESNLARHHLGRIGAVKRGPALLAGLLRCGRCSRKLHVAYGGTGGRVARYSCLGGNTNHGTERCLSFGGLRADEAVSAAVLEAVHPAGIEAAIEAWERASREEDEKRSALGLAIEKARYEADRARRQYDAVEPENRIVASELETRWNRALGEVAKLEARLREAGASRDELGEEERERLLDLGGELEELWNHPAAPVTLKKRIIRTVLKEIVVSDDEPADCRSIDGKPNKRPGVLLRLHWAGGVHTELFVPRNRTGRHRHSTERKVMDLVRDLAKICTDRATASILNCLGCRTGHGNTWTSSRVGALRRHHRIEGFDPESPREWFALEETAREMGTSRHFVRRLLKEGILPGHQVVPYAPWVIKRESLKLPGVQKALRAYREGGSAPRRADDRNQLPLLPTS